MFVLAALLCAAGALLAVTGAGSVRSGQALVRELRGHGSVATAVVSDLGDHVVQTRGGQAAFANWGLAFRLPSGALVIDEDTPFDGGYSVAPPARASQMRSVQVRYDPANVDVVLPAAIVAHPSYSRMIIRTLTGTALVLIGACLATWWGIRERRRIRRARTGSRQGGR